MFVFGFTARDWILFAGPYLVWLCIALPLWRTMQHRIRNPVPRALLFAVLFAPTLCPVVREAVVLAPAWLCGLGLCVLAFDPFLHNPKGPYLRYFLELGALPVATLWALYHLAHSRRSRRTDP